MEFLLAILCIFLILPRVFGVCQDGPPCAGEDPGGDCIDDGDCGGLRCFGGYCLECTNNSHCPASYPSCISNSCNPCSVNTDCSSNKKCVNGKCYNCAANGDCTAPNSICHPTLYTCIQCIDDSQCTSPSAPTCNSGSCVSCSFNSNCDHLGGKSCQGGICVPCTSNGMCDSNKYCNSNQQCVLKDCLDSTGCTNPPFCDPNTFNCRGCNSDGECLSKFPSHPKCALGPHVCVECEFDNQCTDPILKFCKGNSCSGCTDNTDCAFGDMCNTNTGVCYTPECPTNPIECTNPTDSYCNSLYLCEPCILPAHCSHISGKHYCDSGECVECIQPSHCTSTSLPTCTNNVCTTCVGNPDCDHFLTETHCLDGKCVECLDDNDCPDEKPICNLGTNTCQICSDSNECLNKDPSQPYCDTSGKCFACIEHNHCPSRQFSRCDSVSHDCQSCLEHSQCYHFAEPFHLANCYQSECINCPKNCDTCSSSDYCTECTSPFKTFDGECGIECKPGWSKNDNGICAEVCGDGVKRKDLPYCDDGNTIDWDGCSSSCQVEEGWVCMNGGKETRDNCIERPRLNVIQTEKNSSIIFLKFTKSMDMPDDIEYLIEVSLIDVNTSFYDSSITRVNESSYKLIIQLVNKRIVNPLLKLTILDLHQAKDTHGITVEKKDYLVPLDTLHYITSSQGTAIESVNLVGNIVSVTAMISIGPVLLVGANPALVWCLISLLQIFFYLLLINVEYPLNAQQFLRIFAMGRFEFLPNPIYWFIPNLDEEQIDTPFKFLKADMNSLFLMNAGEMLTILIFSFIGYLIAFLAIKYIRDIPALLRNMFIKIRNSYQWSGFLRNWMAGYMDLCISAFLQTNTLVFDTTVHKASSIFALAIMGMNLCLPFWICFKITQNKKDLKKLLPKHSCLIEEFKTDSNETLYANVFILAKRCIVAASLVFLQKHPYIQIFSLTFLNIMAFFYMVRYRPYQEKGEMITNFWYELGFLIIHIVIILIAYDNESMKYSETTRLILGWVIIGSCLTLLTLTLWFIAVSQFNSIVSAYKNLTKVVVKEKISTQQKTLKPSNKVYAPIDKKILHNNFRKIDLSPSMKTTTTSHKGKRRANISSLETSIGSRKDDDMKEYFDKLAKEIMFKK